MANPSKIVLSYGNTVNVNFTSYPDLFISLRGGSNNFGVVTRIDFVAFSLGRFWGGNILYPISALDGNAHSLANLANSIEYDKNAWASIGVLYSSKSKSWSVLSSLAYTAQPPLVNASTLDRFTSIKPQLTNSMRVSTMSDFANELRPSASELGTR
jgi:hypothetical protein